MLLSDPDYYFVTGAVILLYKFIGVDTYLMGRSMPSNQPI